MTNTTPPRNPDKQEFWDHVHTLKGKEKIWYILQYVPGSWQPLLILFFLLGSLIGLILVFGYSLASCTFSAIGMSPNDFFGMIVTFLAFLAFGKLLQANLRYVDTYPQGTITWKHKTIFSTFADEHNDIKQKLGEVLAVDPDANLNPIAESLSIIIIDDQRIGSTTQTSERHVNPFADDE